MGRLPRLHTYLSKGCSSWGADMGRMNVLPLYPLDPIKLRLERLEWIDGDYDCKGAYWGNDRDMRSIFYARGEDFDGVVEIFVREPNREEAKKSIRELLPNAKFYN